VPGATTKGACVYERVLTWALEAEKLDLPQLGARCERMIAMQWEHLKKYKLHIAALSSDARHRIMMGMFKMSKAVQSRPTAHYSTGCSCSTSCRHCGKTYTAAQASTSTNYPSWEDFMSWRTMPGGAS